MGETTVTCPECYEPIPRASWTSYASRSDGTKRTTYECPHCHRLVTITTTGKVTTGKLGLI